MDLLSTEENGKDWCITCNIKYFCNNNVLNVKKQHCYIDKFGARCLFVPWLDFLIKIRYKDDIFTVKLVLVSSLLTS